LPISSLLTGLVIMACVVADQLHPMSSLVKDGQQQFVPVRDDSTTCVQNGIRFRAKSLILRCEPDMFDPQRLVPAVARLVESYGLYDELSILLISTDDEAQILRDVWVDNDMGIRRRRMLTDKYLTTSPIAAEYYRLKGDEILWFTTDLGTVESVVLQGTDPYKTAEAAIPFSVIRNHVVSSWDESCLRREMAVVICPGSSFHSDVLSLCRYVDERFPSPASLTLKVNSSAPQLQDEMRGRFTMEAIYPFVLRGNRFSAQCLSQEERSAIYIRNELGRRISFSDRSDWEQIP